MKLSNLFKKKAKKETTSSVQELDNNHLAKLIGGMDSNTETITQDTNSKNPPRYIVKADGIV